MNRSVPFSDLQGKTLVSVEITEDMEVVFTCSDGSAYKMHHEQDCCESVRIEDIDGDIQRLVGQPIVVAEERVSYDDPPTAVYDDSFTWTFYVLRTNLDSVTIRWLGTSNGYYSESVNFVLTREAV